MRTTFYICIYSQISAAALTYLSPRLRCVLGRRIVFDDSEEQVDGNVIDIYVRGNDAGASAVGEQELLEVVEVVFALLGGALAAAEFHRHDSIGR